MLSITDQIRAKFDSDSLEVTPRIVAEFGYECANSLVRQFAERSISKEWARPSGWNCARKKACVKHGIEGEDLDLRAITTFFNGDLHEASFVAMALSAGVDLRFVGHQQLTVPTVLGKGHTDGVYVKESVLEIKSVSDFGFQKLMKMPERCSVTELDNAFGYGNQTNCYMDGVFKMGLIEQPLVRFIAVSKQNLAFTEKVLEFDKGMLLRCVEEFAAVERSESPWELERFEPDFKKGSECLPVQCAYCPFKEQCWGADGYSIRMEQSGRSKVWIVEGGLR